MMSGFEAEFERLRREVEDAVKRVLDLAETHSSRLSEVEARVGRTRDSGELEGLLKEVKGLRLEVRDELLKARGELFRELRAFRDRLRDAALAEPKRRDELREAFDDLREFFEDRFEEAEDRLDGFLDRVEDVEDEVRDRLRDLRREVKREAYVMKFRVPEAPEARVHEVKIPDIGKLVEDALSRAWRGSMIVSSVRLPKTDLDLIDALVEAGLFRSRNDAIAFFAHKGIEASEDWLRSVKDKVGEIKKLQEETRRELERMLGEAEKPGEKGEGERKED
jgi:Arc/MetJ-type ribon-helix-helix transcriptional regulator